MNEKQVYGLTLFITGNVLFILAELHRAHIAFLFFASAINCLGIYLMFKGCPADD